MWFTARTPIGKEEESKTLLLDNISDNVLDVYIPYIHKSSTKNGVIARKYEIAIKGYMFVNLNINDIHVNGDNVGVDDFWKKATSFLTPNGYFSWLEKKSVDGEQKKVRRKTSIHLLTINPSTATPKDIFYQSYVPQKSILKFRK